MSPLKTLLQSLVIYVLLKVTITLAAPNLQHSFASPGPRIINGTIANRNNTKHQVSVRRLRTDSFFFGSGHICGGSLIAPTVVLSAAHCFVNFNLEHEPYISALEFIVVMGNLDRYERDEDTLVYSITHIIFGSDQFNSTTYDQDIALLFLEDTVPKHHPTVQPILINRKTVPAGTMCQVTGWGTTENSRLSDVLMSVDLPTISNEVCDNEAEHVDAKRIDGMFCAGYMEGERDSCNGDSGGPFVCNGVLVGIVSWGEGCAEPKLPGVYTDVMYYAQWIEERVKEAGGTLERGNGAMSSLGHSIVLLICVTSFSSNFRVLESAF